MASLKLRVVSSILSLTSNGCSPEQCNGKSDASKRGSLRVIDVSLSAR